ncbi:MAG: SDR family NAD(P)-dependent oxidoreductase [Myxococcota bacterium]|nr:SDR family NAD(P)-dependent oxidoreductase [Myxococcota bacterium]
MRGKTIAITGAGRGIGLATALELSRAGARIIIIDIDAASAKTGVTSVEERGGQALSCVMDVSDSEVVEQTVADLVKEHGPVDILINNAGIMCLGNFLELSPKENERQIQVNLRGVINLMRAFLPHMEERNAGHIVNIASLAGKFGVPYSAIYSATKHAVVGLTEAVRAEYLDSNIGFTYVLPSVVDTELFDGVTAPKWPPKVTPQDVAKAVHSALQKGQVDVFVPKIARLSLVLELVLPRFAQDKLRSVLQVSNMFKDVNSEARAEYRLRSMFSPAANDAGQSTVSKIGNKDQMTEDSVESSRVSVLN